MGRKLTGLLLALMLLFTGCTAEPSSGTEPENETGSTVSESAAGEESSSVPEGSITAEEAKERVRELLIENSQKLCTTDENIAMLQNSVFTCEEQGTVDGQTCWLVNKGTGRYAVTLDGEHLYEWLEVTGSYAPIQ